MYIYVQALAGMFWTDDAQAVKNCLLRAISGGPVYVNDTLTKYVGICMDQCFIDVTDVECKVGDEVTVFGRTKSGKLLSAFDVADFCNQPYQQFVVAGTERVGKVFKY